MQFEYDPERLIEEVSKRPGIWNYEDSNYKSMATRLELWNEVVRELLQPDLKVTKTEMRELVLQLQKKWKSIKDSFQKYVQNPNRTKRPYIYSRQLQFLMKNETSGDLGGGDGGGSSESEDVPAGKKKKKLWKQKIQNKISIKNEEYSDDDDNDAIDNDKGHYAEVDVGVFLAEDNEPLAKLPRMAKTDEFAFASVETKSVDGEDCDKMFLLSLLPHLKSVPEESRLNAKMELLRVLRNFQRDNVRGNVLG